MSRLTEVFWTIVAGTSVFVVGQILVKLVLEPIQDLWRLIGEIAHALVFYANVYSNPDVAHQDLVAEAHEKFRQQSSLLSSKLYAITWFSLWSLLRVIPPQKDIEDAVGRLIGLSNNVLNRAGGAENIDRARLIEKLLRIRR